MFGEINTTSDGHITLEEFSNFIKSVESGAKREQKELPADRGQNTEATIAKGSGTVTATTSPGHNDSSARIILAHLARHKRKKKSMYQIRLKPLCASPTKKG